LWASPITLRTNNLFTHHCSLITGDKMVLNISDEEFVRMKMAALDLDKEEALRILKELVKRLQQQKNQGLKSHLE